MSFGKFPNALCFPDTVTGRTLFSLCSGYLTVRSVKLHVSLLIYNDY